MDIIDVGPWRLGIDPQQTRDAFRGLGPTWNRCDCLYCENLGAALGAHLPARLRELLERLGVNPQCWTDAGAWYNDPAENNLYGVWWHAVGTLVRGPAAKPQHLPSSDLGDDITITFHDGRDCLREEFPAPTLQLNAFFSVPWVLDRKP